MELFSFSLFPGDWSRQGKQEKGLPGSVRSEQQHVSDLQVVFDLHCRLMECQAKLSCDPGGGHTAQSWWHQDWNLGPLTFSLVSWPFPLQAELEKELPAPGS